MNNTPPRSSNDRGWGVGEERPSRYVSDQRHSTAKQINSAVGYGACRRTEAFPINVIQMRSKSNALLRGVINVAPYKFSAAFIVGDDACDIPRPFRSTSLNREADQFCRRVRRLPTYRSLSDQCHPNVQQIKRPAAVRHKCRTLQNVHLLNRRPS